jgi:hypothetical protein
MVSMKSMNTTEVKKKRISVASAKNKGRVLQNHVVKVLLNTFPQFTDNDIRSCSMGSNGEDVLFSQSAKDLLGISIECKSRANMKTIYNWYKQAETNAKSGAPVVVIKQDRCKPLVIIDFNMFMEYLHDRTID